VLSRGFALVRGEDGAMLRRAAEVKPGSALDIEFADGHVGAHADAAARKPEPAAKTPRRRGDDKQGSLL
jgi:exodeoxyribonuclease VII large subunit